ncbi:deaminase domain-containing protein [Metabacillus fastidiosus]|uniref:deaminase domain-containing protein n=1 Tax=Metabacillus fastidiosus TaxID=1458 RepID=UPI002E23BE4B|nr:deaminase domain-containing protein [Metabacillus fastidiosus]
MSIIGDECFFHFSRIAFRSELTEEQQQQGLMTGLMVGGTAVSNIQQAVSRIEGAVKKIGDLKIPTRMTREQLMTTNGAASDLNVRIETTPLKDFFQRADSGGSGSKVDKDMDNLSYAQKVDRFQERAQTIRDTLPNKYKNYGNVAVADVKISGLKSEFKAHSRIHKEHDGDFSFVVGEGQFPAKSVNQKGEFDGEGAFLRANDTERKILEDIARQLGDNKTIKGTIDLFTELPACGSCTDIIMQFRREYPNIKLNVYSGEFNN